MDHKNLMPQQAQPIERITTGQLPDVLAELSEEALNGDTSSSTSVLPVGPIGCVGMPVGVYCSYDGEDAE